MAMPRDAGDLLVIAATLRSAGCVFADDEARLIASTACTADEIAAMVEQRAAGLPLEHVLGWAEFCGRRIVVAPGVFVPRRRTELLASEAVAQCRRFRPAGVDTVVVDLCCGSGALGAVMLAELDRVELHAADIDPAAVRCARRNIAAAGHVHEGDLFAALPATLRGRVDVVVANAPYVPTGDLPFLPPEARLHEAPVALDGGRDGLAVLRRLIEAAPDWLAPGGSVLVETSDRQASDIVDALTLAGLLPQVRRFEDLDATVVIGTRGSR